MPAPRKYSQELPERALRLGQWSKTRSLLSINQAVRRLGERVGVVPDMLKLEAANEISLARLSSPEPRAPDP